MRLHERQQSLRSRTLVISVLFSVVCSVLFLPVSFVHAGISSVINEFLFDIAYSLGGILVSASGWALDGALKELVFGMGTLMNGGLGISINTVWVIVRDGFNLLFIFGLIFIGLKLIWNYDDSRAKGTLVTLIIAALLINFSLFIAKFIVDFSNIAALQIFNMMGNTLAVQPVGGAPTLFNAWDGGIAGYVLHLVGLASLGNIESAASGFGVAIMVFIFLLFTALVFLAGAFLLVTRFVMLSFYMIFSPVMFLGLILPKMKSMQDRWWDGFLKQAFFAPAYLFCVYIALRILAGTKEAISKGGQLSAGVGELGGAGNGVFTGAANSPGFMTILFLIISLGFMIAAVLVANKMSIHGASGSMMMIKGARSRLQRGMGNATSGAVARVGRNTAGAGAQKFVDSKAGRYVGGNLGAVGRVAYQTAGGVADSSFDARNVKLGTKTIGKELDIGEGKKGGFVTRVKEDVKTKKAFLESLGTRDVKQMEKDGTLEAEKAKIKPYADAKAVQEHAKSVNDKAKKDAGDAELKLNEVKNKQRLAGADEQAKKMSLSAERETATDERKVEIDKEIAVLEKTITEKAQVFSADIAGLEAEVATTKATFEKTQATAKTADANFAAEESQVLSRIKYANQLAYLENADKSNKSWGGRIKHTGAGTAGGGAVGGAATVTAAGVIAGAALAAPIAMGAAMGSNYQTKLVLDDLKKAYEKGGSSKDKSEEETKKMKSLAKLVADQAEAKDSGKKDDDKA